MNPGNYSDRLLEGRLTREQFDTIARAATAGWDPAYAADPANAAAVEDVVFRRHDNALKFVVPWVQDIRPLGGSKVIDFGSGCGSSALAFSYYARAVEGFEIDQPSVDAFRARMDVFGVANAKVQLAGPEEILEGALAAVEPGTTFVFLAVVEHLLEEERISYLRAAWNALHPGDLLVIAETPNYYAYFDGHTFGVPFASMVPDPYFERWLVQQGDGLRFGKDLRVLAETQGIEAALTQRRRLGLGVTHHAFELAFEQDLNEIASQMRSNRPSSTGSRCRWTTARCSRHSGSTTSNFRWGSPAPCCRWRFASPRPRRRCATRCDATASGVTRSSIDWPSPCSGHRAWQRPYAGATGHDEVPYCLRYVE